MRLIELKSPVGCDTETTGLNPWKGDRPYAFTFCDINGQKEYRRARVLPATRSVHINRALRDELREFYAGKHRKVFHNAKFDVQMMEASGVWVRKSIVEESRFAMWLVSTNEPTYALKPLCQKYLDYPMEDQTELHRATIAARREAKKKGWKVADHIAADYWMAPNLLLRRYAVNDAERCLLLWLFAMGILEEESLTKHYDFEMRLWPQVYEMEKRGPYLNVEKNREMIAQFEKKAKKCYAKIQQMHPGLNPMSHKQLADIYFRHYGLEPDFHTDAGNPSTNVPTHYENQHPFVKQVVQYKSAMKAVSTFFQKFEELKCRDPISGGWCFHPQHNQLGTATTRFACSNPNMQNVSTVGTTKALDPIPAREPIGPRPGYRWWHFDYSQLEARIYVDRAQDDFMLDILRRGDNVHGAAANRVWGGKGNESAIRNAAHALELDGSGKEWKEKPQVLLDVFHSMGFDRPEEQLVSEDRFRLAETWMKQHGYDIVEAEKSIDKKITYTMAKAVFYLKIFCGGSSKLAKWIRKPGKEAKLVLDEYDRSFPKIKQFQRQRMNAAMERGYTETASGRRIYVDRNKIYKCVNYEIQGSAAELLKRAMILTGEYLKQLRKDRRIDAWLLLTIHDELVFEIKQEHSFLWLLRKLKRLMEDHGGVFSIPMPVEIKLTRKSWEHPEEFVL